MGRGPGRPVKTRSGLMVTADVVVAVAGVHHISWVAVRAGPSKHMGRLMGRASGPYRAHISWTAARPGPSNFERMGRGPAQPIKILEDGPRPGPGHQKFRGWVAARPSPSHFQIFKARPGPAHPIFIDLGPAHHIFKSLGPARPGPSQLSDRPGPARPRQTAHDKPCFFASSFVKS